MTNPFIKPSPQLRSLEQKHRERFKISVYAGLGGLGLLLFVLLIQGCHSAKLPSP